MSAMEVVSREHLYKQVWAEPMTKVALSRSLRHSQTTASGIVEIQLVFLRLLLARPVLT